MLKMSARVKKSLFMIVLAAVFTMVLMSSASFAQRGWVSGNRDIPNVTIVAPNYNYSSNFYGYPIPYYAPYYNYNYPYYYLPGSGPYGYYFRTPGYIDPWGYDNGYRYYYGDRYDFWGRPRYNYWPGPYR
jgi:hypothetical protein